MLKDLHVIKTCDSFNGNFFYVCLNIVSGILLQSEIVKQSTRFSAVHSFVKNLHDTETELYINPGDANM